MLWGLNMQPFDYRLAVQNPVAMALQGYQQGQQMVGQREEAAMNRELFDLKKQEYQANQAKLAQEQARAQAMQTDFATFTEGLSNGTSTIDDVFRLNGLYPEIAEQVQAAYQMKTDVQKNNEIKESLALALLFRNAPEEGAAKLAEKIAIAEEAGDMERVAALKTIEASIGVSPDAPVASAIFTLSNLVPAEQFKLIAEQLGLTPEKVPESYRALQLRAEAAGFQEGTPEYREFMEQGGADRGPIAQINVGGEAGAFETAIGKGQAENIMTVSTQGQTARRNRQTLTTLQSELAASPAGAEAAVKSVLGNFGIPSEGLSNIQAAEALINQLVPAQRPPGSGTMSDRDVALFKSSLPRLINTPEGNRKIIQTMIAMNDYLIREGELADAVIDGAITREQYREQIRALGNPLAEFSAGAGTPQARRRFDAQGREIK